MFDYLFSLALLAFCTLEIFRHPAGALVVRAFYCDSLIIPANTRQTRNCTLVQRDTALNRIYGRNSTQPGICTYAIVLHRRTIEGGCAGAGNERRKILPFSNLISAHWRPICDGTNQFFNLAKEIEFVPAARSGCSHIFRIGSRALSLSFSFLQIYN